MRGEGEGWVRLRGKGGGGGLLFIRQYAVFMYSTEEWEMDTEYFLFLFFHSFYVPV